MKPAHRLVRNQRGASTIEFAFALPLLIFVLMYGSYEAWQIISAALRVDRAASHVATVAARADATLDEGALTSLLTSADRISAPTKILTDGRVIISAVEGGPGGKILWQRCKGAKIGYASAVGIPNAVANMSGNGFPMPPADTTALVAETYYEYHFVMTDTMMPPIVLKHKAISLGREDIPDTILTGGISSGC
jgi:hypothetical protein